MSTIFHGYALARALEMEACEIANDDRRELVGRAAIEIRELIEQQKELSKALARLLRADERPPTEEQANEAIEAMADARIALQKAGAQ